MAQRDDEEPRADNNDDLASSRASTPETICSVYGTPVKSVSNCTFENNLYEKNLVQANEIERLEIQNNEYREKLLKTIREKDLVDETLKKTIETHNKELEQVEKKWKDVEYQLKSQLEKSQHQEKLISTTLKETNTKYEATIKQLNQKCEENAKAKNEAVVRYAIKEKEIMQLRDDLKKRDDKINELMRRLQEENVDKQQAKIEELEATLVKLRVEMDGVKHEKFEFENRAKAAEKRCETINNQLTDVKHQAEILRKQLIQAKDEKSISQQIEMRVSAETSQLQKKLTDAENTIDRLKTTQIDLAGKLTDSSENNTAMTARLELLEEQLRVERERASISDERIQYLKKFEDCVNGAEEKVEEMRKKLEAAMDEKIDAEREAEECQKHAERALRLTQELTERNSCLIADLDKCKYELQNMHTTIDEYKEKHAQQESIIAELKEQNATAIAPTPSEPSSPTITESVQFCASCDENAKTLTETSRKLSELQNDYSAYRKKSHANIKELRQELSKLKASASNSSPNGLVDNNGSNSSSLRSRASSPSSIDQVTTTSKDDECSEERNRVQQTMIDKIIDLQKKLARRNDKIELLEEHARQCLDELKKKSKIIQHFALREEASLLMPNDASLDKLFDNFEFVQVPIVRNKSMYALMGGMFTAGSEKKQMKLMTEINSKLHAVLEDSIQKNITMRSSVDKLQSENTRLSRENRLLSLTNNSS